MEKRNFWSEDQEKNYMDARRPHLDAIVEELLKMEEKSFIIELGEDCEYRGEYPEEIYSSGSEQTLLFPIEGRDYLPEEKSLYLYTGEFRDEMSYRRLDTSYIMEKLETSGVKVKTHSWMDPTEEEDLAYTRFKTENYKEGEKVSNPLFGEGEVVAIDTSRVCDYAWERETIPLYLVAVIFNKENLKEKFSELGFDPLEEQPNKGCWIYNAHLQHIK